MHLQSDPTRKELAIIFSQVAHDPWFPLSGIPPEYRQGDSMQPEEAISSPPPCLEVASPALPAVVAVATSETGDSALLTGELLLPRQRQGDRSVAMVSAATNATKES